MLVALAVSTLLTVSGSVSTAPAAPAAAAVTDPAALLPAGTLLYFGTDSVRAGSQAAKSSVMRAILDEPEVKAFLAKPISVGDRELAKLVKESGMLEAPRFTLSDLMSGEGDGTPIGRMFLALTHFTMPDMKAETGMPDMGWVVGLELLESADLALIRALWDRIPAPEETATHAGHEYLTKPLGDGPRVALAFVGNLAVASLSERTLQNVLTQAASPNAASLADSADYKELRALGEGAAHSGSSTWIVRIEPMMGMVRTVLQLAAASEEAREVAPAIMKMIDRLGVGAIRWAGGTGWRDTAGRVHGSLGVRFDHTRTGLIPRMLGASVEVKPELLAQVPANSLSFTAGSVEGLGELYDIVMEMVEAVEPAGYAMINGMLESVMEGASLRDDILDNMHGLMTSWSLPPEGISPQPSSVLSFSLRRPERFPVAVTKLIEGINTMFLDGLGMPVGLIESEHEGRTLWELDISGAPGAEAMFSPAFAIDGTRLIASLESARAVKTTLNGTLDGGSLSGHTELVAFMRKQAARGSLTGLTFSDNAKTFGAMYSQLTPPLQMFGGALGDIPVDLSLLPSEQSIRKHLRSSYMASYTARPGLVVAYGISDFELGDFVPLAIVSGMAVAAHMEAAGTTEEEEVIELSPAAQVRADLAQLNAGLSWYKLEMGDYPAKLDDLVRPMDGYPDGFIGRQALPLDPWGNAYRFRLNEKNRPFLWSVGPDGIDDGGEGDDITRN